MIGCPPDQEGSLHRIIPSTLGSQVADLLYLTRIILDPEKDQSLDQEDPWIMYPIIVIPMAECPTEDPWDPMDLTVLLFKDQIGVPLDQSIVQIDLLRE